MPEKKPKKQGPVLAKGPVLSNSRLAGADTPDLPCVGWREWVALPALGVPAIKAKVDTGARSSSLHAFDVEEFLRKGVKMLRFVVHPFQRDSKTSIECEAPLLEHRRVRSSSGHSVERPVILTTLEVRGVQFEVEITLARRDQMGFRMLLGREAVRRRFVIDPGNSYYGGRPARALRRPRR